MTAAMDIWPVIEKYEELAKKLKQELLIYIDERGNISRCFLTHDYAQQENYLGTVVQNEQGKYEFKFYEKEQPLWL